MVRIKAVTRCAGLTRVRVAWCRISEALTISSGTSVPLTWQTSNENNLLQHPNSGKNLLKVHTDIMQLLYTVWNFLYFYWHCFLLVERKQVLPRLSAGKQVGTSVVCFQRRKICLDFGMKAKLKSTRLEQNAIERTWLKRPSHHARTSETFKWGNTRKSTKISTKLAADANTGNSTYFNNHEVNNKWGN